MNPIELLPLAVLGGVVGIDAVGFPQAMISRPLVAATLAGALAGHAAAGLVVGATLEFFALETLPFGASRYPEWGPAAVVGSALFVSQPEDRAGTLVTAVVAALVVAWVGGWTMVRLRGLNGRWLRFRRAALSGGSRREVTGAQLIGLTLDLARGAGLAFAGLACLRPAQAMILAHWSTDDRTSRAVVTAVAIIVGVGAAWKVFHGTPGARWLFLAGLVVGLLLLFAL